MQISGSHGTRKINRLFCCLWHPALVFFPISVLLLEEVEGKSYLRALFEDRGWHQAPSHGYVGENRSLPRGLKVTCVQLTDRDS